MLLGWTSGSILRMGRVPVYGGKKIFYCNAEVASV